jgi:hypothetical protein
MQDSLFLCLNLKAWSRMLRFSRHHFAMLSLTFLLVACDQAATETGPGGVSKDDARALDAAAEKLDAEPPLPVIPVTQPEPTANKSRLKAK